MPSRTRWIAFTPWVTPWLAIAAVVLPSLAARTALFAQTPATTVVPFQAGDRYFFTADSGTLYVRDGDHSVARPLLPAKSYGTLAPSRNGRYIAYTLPAPVGTTSFEVRIRDVDSRQDLSEALHNASITTAPWTDNHRGFFYARFDTTEHRERVYYHRVGEPQSRDEIIYSRPDPTATNWHYAVRVSDDGHYAVFTITHPIDDHTRIYVIDLDNPGKPAINAPIVKLVDEFSARYTFIDNGGSSFFLLTDRGAPRGHIVIANLDNTQEARWPTGLREVADTLRNVYTAGDVYLVAVYRNGTKPIARVYSPPDPKEMREEMRRRADSTRHAGNDSTPQRGGGRGRGGNGGGYGGRGGAGGGMNGGEGAGRPSGPMELFGFRLDLRREIPFPEGATLVGMQSLADKPVLFYTIALPDGSLRSYAYNVKTGENTPFDSRLDNRR